MASYDVVSTITIRDTAGNVVPGGEKREWKDLSKDQVLKIEGVMTSYLKGLAKTAQKRASGFIKDPEGVDQMEKLFVTSECVIYKDGKEWAYASFRLPNQNLIYLGIMYSMFTTAANALPRKINAKMTVTRGE